MKADNSTNSLTAVFSSPHEPLEMTYIPVPALKDREILIRTEYTTLCRSDLNTFSGKRQEKSPTILGHEIVGRIAAFGPNTPQTDLRGCPLQVGDRVTWSIFASDPAAELSRRGMPQKAPGLFKYGHEQITAQSTLHGGLSQYCILRPLTTVIKLDESIPLPIAAPVNCAGATVAGALRLAGDIKGRRVMISGVGMLGLFACAMSRAGGAQRIVAIDANPERLDRACQFGAHETRLASSQTPVSDEPVDIVVELSGTSEAMESALERMDIGATAVWVGATHPQAPVRVDAERTIRRLHTIKGLHNYNAQDLLQAVEFVEQHHQRFPFIKLISDRFTLDAAQEAFAYALASNCHRVGIRIEV